MDQAIEVQNIPRVARASQFEYEVGCIANASRNGNLEDTQPIHSVKLGREVEWLR